MFFHTLITLWQICSISWGCFLWMGSLRGLVGEKVDLTLLLSSRSSPLWTLEISCEWVTRTMGTRKTTSGTVQTAFYHVFLPVSGCLHNTFQNTWRIVPRRLLSVAFVISIATIRPPYSGNTKRQSPVSLQCIRDALPAQSLCCSHYATLRFTTRAARTFGFIITCQTHN